jgi:hypothetical protein
MTPLETRAMMMMGFWGWSPSCVARFVRQQHPATATVVSFCAVLCCAVLCCAVLCWVVFVVLALLAASQVGRALLEAVSLSTAAELQRRMEKMTAAAAAAAAGEGDVDYQASAAACCSDVCRAAKELIIEEHDWTR